MNPAQQKANAKKFIERWQNEPGNEEEQSRSFWIQLLEEVLGIQNATHVLQFERKVKGRKIDVFYEDMGILIEQKGRGISLDEATVRSKKAGPETPYQQACWYANNLPFSIRPRWIITCNFDEIRIYDQDQEDTDHYETVLLKNLVEESYRLSFFTDKKNSRIEQEKQLSVQAGEIVGKLYEQLSSQYKNIETDLHEQYSLNVLIVRLVFLLYAEDAQLLQNRDAFLDYLKQYSAQDIRSALISLFKILDTPEDERDPYANPELLAFPYVNGGLFQDENIVIPQFTEQSRHDLLLNASQAFNWSGISPTIFGSVFESTLNPETRRSGGMHYTSIENIHKVIDPLFLNDLQEELEKIEGVKSERDRNLQLKGFQRKLGSINVLDPACGSGNFLTETYLSLRKLENRVIEDLQGDQMAFGFTGEAVDPIQVTIDQFYGIEINDFAVSVAKTALWIAESQMMQITEEILYQSLHFLPLKSNASIVEGNALRMDWNDVLPAEKCIYICGNPPFIGYSNHTKEQQEDRALYFDKVKTVDYVACWYKKAADYMSENKRIHAALVSTNSICHGQQVEPIWKPLFEQGIVINFAWQSFVWNNEATDQAHVHVIIVGFSYQDLNEKKIYKSEQSFRIVKNINAYLVDAKNVFITNRAKPICRVDEMIYGNKPADGGFLLLSAKEKEQLIKKEPQAEYYIRQMYGAREYINGIPRYCLWLYGVDDKTIQELPLVLERVNSVKQFRLKSPKAATREDAKRAKEFSEIRQPDSYYVVIPRHSSERRKYVPFGFVSKEIIVNDAVSIIPNATLYIFGVMISQFHNAWMRSVAGRLKSDYRYSNKIVYNNFVWAGAVESPNVSVEEAISKEVRSKIEQCAQAVLNARDAHPDKSLADLYDPDRMPADLLAAHKALDKAVEEAYGVDFDGNEEKIVAHLFKLYAEMTKD